jgi:outer membrane protein TolC
MSAIVALGAPLSAQTQAANTPATPPAPKLALTSPQAVPPQGAMVLQLSMDQAVQMAVDANLGLKANRLNVEIAAEGIAGAEAAFRPTLSGSAFKSSSTRLPSSFTDLTSGSIASASVSGGASVTQLMPWLGGQYSASWNNNRSTTNQPQPVFNPQLTSSVQFAYTQPLLRNFLIDPNRAALENSQTQQQVANIDLQLRTITLQNQVRLAYR